MRRCGYIGGDLTILPPDEKTYRCRVLYDRKIVKIEFLAYEKKPIKTLKVTTDDDIEYSKKYLDRAALLDIFAKKDGADDVLIVKNGFATDTTIANVAFLDENGVWLTPKNPLLLGTTRERLLNDGFLKERYIRGEELKNFKSVAITNALRGFEELGNPRLVLI